MRASSTASAKRALPEGQAFIAAASAAMLRAARQVAAENKRLGLPLIVEKSRRAAVESKQR